MSRETQAWLDNNILVGMTDRFGSAWHRKSGVDAQGRPNHFPAEVPMDRVRELLDVRFSPRRVYVDMGELGLVEDVDRRAWVRDGTTEIADIHSEGYAGHQYHQVLIRNTEQILGEGLVIAGAGRLRRCTIGYVQVEMPENLHAAGGVVFRPWLMATTSFDGSIATTYKRGFTKVVCDNTRALALSERGESYRIRHTRNSEVRVREARHALAVINEMADAFAAEVEQLLRVEVTDRQWRQFVEAHAPIKANASPRSVSMAEKKRNDLTRLWTRDYRVQPWAGTSYGVVQAVNTYVHHLGTVRGANRVERNMIRAVTGEIESLDRATLTLLGTVMDRDLAAAA